MKRKIILALLLIGMIDFHISAVEAAEQRYVAGMTNQQFIERFSDLVFGENRDHQLSKFLGPIRITLKGSDPKVVERYRPKIEQATAKLREAAGIDIAIRQGEEKANYAFVLSETPVFDMLVTVRDIAKFFAGNDEERFYEDVKEFEKEPFFSTTNFIAIDPGNIRGCMNVQKVSKLDHGAMALDTVRRLEYSLLYCLGLKRHLFENDSFSIIANKFENIKFSLADTSFTEFDLQAIKLLYSDRLDVGMEVQEAKNIIERVLDNQ